MTQLQKAEIKQLHDEGKWFKVLLLVLQLGIEAIKYLRELRKEKSNKITE